VLFALLYQPLYVLVLLIFRFLPKFGCNWCKQLSKFPTLITRDYKLVNEKAEWTSIWTKLKCSRSRCLRIRCLLIEDVRESFNKL
jgi:hypothetical protein